jgi:heat-inducible transcriptional repressor
MGTDLTSELPSERARHVLRILVEHYIREGQPVGSRTLSLSTGLDLSPATIRNVMADLEDLGFIAAPHTSAGRIPTAKGYRFFVDTLVRLQPMAEPDVVRLQGQLEENFRGNAKAIAAAASSALSAMTSLAGIVTIPRQHHATLRHIEFLPLSGRRVLAILVVNDAEVQNRILDMARANRESRDSPAPPRSAQIPPRERLARTQPPRARRGVPQPAPESRRRSA